jgi:hypothetical protein
MPDPLARLASLAFALATTPETMAGDPGPSASCPDDMRLVSGVHYETMSHLCVDSRKEGKDTRCYRYLPELSVLTEPATTIAVCMDQYEAPNQRGARPLVMQSYNSASRFCAERHKRLCTEQEWELACEGPEHLGWVYGWAVDSKLCNSNKGWRTVDFEAFGKSRQDALEESERLWQGSVSGRYKTCVSSFGIFDLTGNVEEWVASRAERRWPGALMGGFWAKPWTGCRGTNDAHEPGFAFYETGFRCCKGPTAPQPPTGPATRPNR